MKTSTILLTICLPLVPVTGIAAGSCTVLADERLQDPLGKLAEAYQGRTGTRVKLSFKPAGDPALSHPKGMDAVFTLSAGEIEDSVTVAWAYPGFIPVRAKVLRESPEAGAFVKFAGSGTGHLIWSESEGGFTIVPDTTAASMEWVAENRVKHTYPLTAQRMLAELGGIREGLCIDIGCGPGQLDVELAKRSKFRIVGLDINPGAGPIFEKRMREAGLGDRVSFVEGDAQALPFPDNHADVIVSRGTLTFIPDIGKCLREVERVLKPTGVAFLGGRYLYTPQHHKISNEKLEAIVRESGVAGAKVVTHRGQWVKIVGPEAPKAAHGFQGGPHMLVNRVIADYQITRGRGLLVCGSDSDSQQGMQRGFLEATELGIVSLYKSAEERDKAGKRGKNDRVALAVGTLGKLPFDDGAFDLVIGAGPMLIFEKDRVRAMREIHRVLRKGGVALIGGRFLGMPDFRKVSSDTLREEGEKSGVSVRVLDNGGQWVEVRKD